MKNHKLEIWADSFHEGEWAASNIAKYCARYSVEYHHGFIPEWAIVIDDNQTLEITIFGSYKSWKNLPKKIEALLSFGKPDIVVYDPQKDEIILAIEETAAVPTGNQALQRCERIFGSAYYKIPFIYLIGEYGVHKDGKVRRTSIWPTLLGLKLSLQFKTPSFSLHYSDVDNPEDYAAGKGLSLTFEYCFLEIKRHLGIDTSTEKQRMSDVTADIIQQMCDFVISQWGNITNFLPDIISIKNDKFSESLAKAILGDAGTTFDFKNFLTWPKAADRDKSAITKDIQLGFIKSDSFLEKVDKLIIDAKGYVISGGVGSRPQDKESLLDWLKAQAAASKKIKTTFVCKLSDFPPSPSGFHITTSKNITYLLDSLSDLQTAYKTAFPKRTSSLSTALREGLEKLPVFLYICNSLKPGRIFGDPFVGQYTAFSNIFCFDGEYKKTRTGIIYTPHQSAGLFFGRDGKLARNKGISIYRELADIIITNDGYLISFAKEELLL